MKEDYNDKDQKIFISWTREEISHVIGNMNIIQGDQNGNEDAYSWKTKEVISLEVCESNHKYKTCYWKYVETAENTLKKYNTKYTYIYT